MNRACRLFALCLACVLALSCKQEAADPFAGTLVDRDALDGRTSFGPADGYEPAAFT